MKKLMIILAMLAALFGVNGSNLLAGEHGGSEHGGTAVEGSYSHGEDHAATLREAASILKATHPDLATKLEEMAKMKE